MVKGSQKGRWRSATARVVVLGGGIAGYAVALNRSRVLKRSGEVVVVTTKSNWNWILSNIWVGVANMKTDHVTRGPEGGQTETPHSAKMTPTPPAMRRPLTTPRLARNSQTSSPARTGICHRC